MAPSARVITGLPAYGPPAIGFSATGKGLHAEGLVVEFPSGGNDEVWVGNFAPGLSEYDQVLSHPNLRDIIVISGGQAYVVDPLSKQVSKTFGGPINGSWNHPSRPWVIFDHQGIRFSALGPMGVVWESGRISWDGFRSVHTESELLRGEAWEPSDAWHPFEIDLGTGEFRGGSYPKTLPGA
jgi:hypothetical protein